MPGSPVDRRASNVSKGSKGGAGGRRGSRGSKGRQSISVAAGGASNMQEALRDAAETAQRKKEEKLKTGRKNKSYLEVKKDMDQKKRLKEKISKENPAEAKTEEVMYIDKDRAAAVSLGSKDLISLKSKRKAGNKKNEEVYDEKALATFMQQGQHELKKGDAERALMYFNKAAAIMTEGNFEYSLFELFILRSQCFCKMGNFVDADRDAEYALNLDPHSVKGLVAKAEAQYNMGAFEHSLKYFYRAQAERPGYYNVGEGMNKAKSAIENSLSTNLNFMEMKDIIKQIINDPNNDLGYEYESSKDPNNFDDDNEKENKKDGSDEINKEIIELEREEERMKIKLEKMDISKKGIVGGITSNTGQDSVFRNFNKNSAILEDNGKKFLEGFKKKQSLKQISSEDSLTKQKKKKEKEQRKADFQLLGKLDDDRRYLEELIKNPVLKKHHDPTGEHFGSNVVRHKVIKEAKEGLAFLENRKSFWQQQEPVFARKLKVRGNNKQSKIPRLKNSERSDAETPQQEPSWNNSESTELRNQDSIENVDSTTESRKDSTWSEGSSDGTENGLESLACDEGLADISAPDSGICSVTLQFTPPSDDMDTNKKRYIGYY